MWWDNAVIYQVYLRSFQDSDGDGIGDLRGAAARLEHIKRLGAAAVWLSPIYPSANADFGYDISDFEAVDPALGTLADFDALIQRAHQLQLKVLLDFVPCHTSIEHPWFRSHPEYYVWCAEPPNNWKAAFGGSAWGLDPVSGRYYLHSFFPEQADLDWRHPELRAQMAHALDFWIQRGVDGFRLDALDRLMKDPQLRDDPPAQGRPTLPMDPEDAKLDHVHSRNAPDIGCGLAEIRRAVGPVFLVGEVFLPARQTGAYLPALDVVFNFEALFAAGDAELLRAAIRAGLQTGQQGWVLSNHDFSRLATRAGIAKARALALVLLTLPGPVFVFAGDELGMRDGRLVSPPQDRNGRDGFRVPMRWDTSAGGGFTTGRPWLSTHDDRIPSVAEQDDDPGSMLTMMRAAIALRRELGPDADVLESPADTLVVIRGGYVIAVNLGAVDQPAPAAGRLVLEARAGDGRDLSVVPAGGGWMATTGDP